ncbi:SRPBCC family protein [Massilia sp. CMS3.1]|uniref:SRPBCC family protein n=1 Tax=Massilia sp. CMS3.1 TaxID=3373083 RepID=UPI003EE4AB0A
MTADTSSSTSTDPIERSILIKAPRARVWRALADTTEFGSWFGVNLPGQAFVPGAQMRGHITHPGYEHIVFEVRIDRVEPEQLLSFYWHPYAIDPAVDYTQEAPTLVSFTLQDTDDGTRLTVVESGFDKVTPARRLEAFRMNSQGWDTQVGNIARHVDGQ